MHSLFNIIIFIIVLLYLLLEYVLYSLNCIKYYYIIGNDFLKCYFLRFIENKIK